MFTQDDHPFLIFMIFVLIISSIDIFNMIF